MALAIFLTGLITFLAILFASLFEKTRVPDVLMLMILGIILGPLLHIVSPLDFGKVGEVATTIALIVILFEGGVNLNITELEDSFDDTLGIMLSSFLVTMTIVSVIIHYSTGIDWLASFITGSILGGTSSAVVVPIIRTLNMSEKSYTILFLESAFTDVICIVVSFALFEAYASGNLSIGRIIGRILATFTMAGLIGFLGATLWGAIIRKVRKIPNTMFSTLAFIFIIYGIAEFLGYSGAIASLSFGISLANLVKIPKDKMPIKLKGLRFATVTRTERTFYSEIVFLLKTFFFVYLGLSMRLADFWIISAGFLITLTILLGRLLVIKVFRARDIPWRDASFMSVMVPKGLAAAVLASIPSLYGVTGSGVIKDTVYAVVFFSILLSALMVPLIERSFLRTVYYEIFGQSERGSGV